MAEEDLTKPLENNDDDEDNANYEPTSHLQLDLGDDSPYNLRESNRLGNQTSGTPSSISKNIESHRREDNPFSFKHFLRSDSSTTTNYQSKGARPKIYENRSASTDYGSNLPESKVTTRMLPEYSSGLPDFVQDHLVVEQCYLGAGTPNNYNLDINNLPDFTPARQNRNSNAISENNPNRTPLDLPVRTQDSFPLDLPLVTNHSNSRNGTTINEVGNSKSLPDFLADSAVCSQKSETLSVPHSPEGEFERLRNELDITKRQLVDKSRLCDSLSRELEVMRTKEHDYTQNLARALEKVEDNLEKSNRRAVAAENIVVKLKKEIKSLTAQLNSMKSDNHYLSGEEAAGGQGYCNSTSSLHYHRLAQELRNAAGTAEHSLRQLLTGVDNLRIMAASLENMHRIEETSDPFSKFDEDSGPAL